MIEMTELDPVSKFDSIISHIKKYNPEITAQESDFIEMKLVSRSGEELWIEISTEFTIFFGDWHAHYFAYAEEYDVFLNDLLGILENKKFTVCTYRNDQWCGSGLSQSETPDEAALRKNTERIK